MIFKSFPRLSVDSRSSELSAESIAQKSKRLIVLTTCQDKFGQSKLRKCCTLPLTAPHCVDRVITDLGVIDCTPQGFVVRELFPGVTPEEFTASSEAPLIFDVENV